jgi:AraC-like DNA-binding protein
MRNLGHFRLSRVLSGDNKTVSSVAFALGYKSESAFSNTFKRVVGQSPSEYPQLTAGRASAPGA